MIHKRLLDLCFAATGMTQEQLTQIAVRLHHSFVLAIAEPNHTAATYLSASEQTLSTSIQATQATARPLSTESPMRANSGKPIVE